jgi:cytochrome c biogenesis protein CcmG/thiol:disulfide interchange protein DsbE
VEPGPLPRPSLKLTGIFVLVVGVGLVIGWVVGRDSPGIAEIGEPAPDFTVELIDGGTFTLSEARGQPVIVNLWASWCAPCREEIPDISEFATANPDVTVVGVAVQDPEKSAREFAATIGATYPLALGTPEFEDAYPHLGLPATFIVDENGTVIEIINGIVNGEILTDALA